MSNKENEDKFVVRPVASSVASKSAQFCASCGAKIYGEASSCRRCGRFFQSRESGAWKVQNSFYRLPALRAYRSAPPTRRILAALADSAIVLSLFAAAELIGHVVLQLHLATASQVFIFEIAYALLVPVAYLLAFDATALQGTPGKALFDLKVTDLSDRTVPFSATATRFAARTIFLGPTLLILSTVLLSGVALNILSLYLTVVFVPLVLYALDVALAFTSEENRTLIDRLSGTMVVRNDRR